MNLLILSSYMLDSRSTCLGLRCYPVISMSFRHPLRALRVAAEPLAESGEPCDVLVLGVGRLAHPQRCRPEALVSFRGLLSGHSVTTS